MSTSASSCQVSNTAVRYPVLIISCHGIMHMSVSSRNLTAVKYQQLPGILSKSAATKNPVDTNSCQVSWTHILIALFHAHCTQHAVRQLLACQEPFTHLQLSDKRHTSASVRCIYQQLSGILHTSAAGMFPCTHLQKSGTPAHICSWQVLCRYEQLLDTYLAHISICKVSCRYEYLSGDCRYDQLSGILNTPQLLGILHSTHQQLSLSGIMRKSATIRYPAHISSCQVSCRHQQLSGILHMLVAVRYLYKSEHCICQEQSYTVFWTNQNYTQKTYWEQRISFTTITTVIVMYCQCTLQGRSTIQFRVS